MNALVSGKIKRASANRGNAQADFAAASAMELGKAVILGNITLSMLDETRIRFDGTPMTCGLSRDFVSVLSITDVAGLVDLRFASDQLLSTLVRGATKASVSNSRLADIRQNAGSGAFLTARDVFLASGFGEEDAGNAASYSTVHGSSFRLARDVTPPFLISVLDGNGIGSVSYFGASPSNRTFRISVVTDLRDRTQVLSEALLILETTGAGEFTKVYEIRTYRQRSTFLPAAETIATEDLPETWCTR